MLAIQEAGRRFGLRVGRVGVALKRHQTGDLVLAPVRVAGSAPEPFRSLLVPTAVHFHRHDRRRVGNARGEFPRAVLLGLLVPLGDHLGSDEFGQSSDVPAADRYVGQKSEGLGRQVERREDGPGVDDLGEDRRAIPVGIEPEVGPLGGKNPGGRRDSGRSALAG